MTTDYEKRRYRRDRRKRIAAELRWQQNNEEYRRKHKLRGKAQQTGRLPGKSARCPHCGRTGGRKERHHISYAADGAWEVRCSKCNPRPGK